MVLYQTKTRTQTETFFSRFHRRRTEKTLHLQRNHPWGFTPVYLAGRSRRPKRWNHQARASLLVWKQQPGQTRRLNAEVKFHYTVLRRVVSYSASPSSQRAKNWQLADNLQQHLPCPVPQLRPWCTHHLRHKTRTDKRQWILLLW